MMAPPNSVRITENEALLMQFNLIKDWKPRIDVWPFTYGLGSLAAAAGATSAHCLNLCRSAFKLKNYGRFSSFLPIVMFPALCTAGMHAAFVSSDVLISKTNCPLCLVTRSTVIQIGLGLVYPIFFSPLLCIPLAAHYVTYPIPASFRPSVIAKYWWTVSQRSFRAVRYMLPLHVLLAFAITYQEHSAIRNIYTKIDKMDEETSLPSSVLGGAE